MAINKVYWQPVHCWYHDVYATLVLDMLASENNTQYPILPNTGILANI